MASRRPPIAAGFAGEAASPAERQLAAVLPARYRVRGRLRRAIGRPVFLAIDEQRGGLVVIKGGADDAAAAVREAGVLARLDHPYIVPLRERVDAAGASFVVIDYIDASSLEAYLAARGGRLDPAALKDLLLALCDALAHVHARGFLHRDLKPANILIRADGTPVIVDFSAALPLAGEAERDGSSLLTDGYAAPEQYASDQPEGPWTDVYGLGALAYRAFIGEAPPPAPERLQGRPMTPAAAHAGPEAAGLAAAIDRALALDPEDRPQSVLEWQDALRVHDDEADQLQPVPPGSEADELAPTVRVQRKRRRLVAERTAAPETPARRQRRIGKLLLGVLLLAGLAAAGAGAAAGLRPLYDRHVKTEWVVDAAGEGDARTIGEALARAGDNARVAIRPGNYAESVVIERPVHLAAAVADEPPVIAPPQGPCLVAGAGGGSVSGLALRRAAPEGGGEPTPCLVVTAGALRVEDSTISNAAGPAIEVRGGAAPEFRHNRIENTTGAGAIIGEGARGAFTGNTITNVEGASLAVRGGAAPEIAENAIENSGPVIFAEGAQGTFARNRVENSRASGIEVMSGADPLLAENAITGAKGAGIFVYDRGRGRFEGNELHKAGLSGVILAGGALARLSGNAIRESGEHGVLVLEGSRGVIEGNTIAQNAGHGIAIAPDAEVELARNQLEGNTDPQLLDARPPEGRRNGST